MSKTTFKFFSIIAILCAIFLAIISLTSTYDSEYGELPSLLESLSNSEDGIIDAYSSNLADVTNMPRHKDGKFFFKLFLFFFKMISSLFIFLAIGLAPVILLLVVILLIKNMSKKLKSKDQDNELLSTISVLAIFSQSYHFIYTLFGLNQKTFSFVRMTLLAIFFFSILIISECTGASKVERKISLTNKRHRLLFAIFVIIAMTFVSFDVPETRVMRILYALSCVEILSLSFGAAIHTEEPDSGILLLYNVLISQLFFFFSSLYENGFSPTTFIAIVICDLILLAIAHHNTYKYFLFSAKYPFAPRKILTGICTGKQLQASKKYSVGISKSAHTFARKVLAALLIFMASLVAATLSIRFLFINVFKLNDAEEVAAVVQLLTIVISLVIVSCRWLALCGRFDTTDYVEKCWKGKNSAACIAFSFAFAGGYSLLFFSVIFLFKLSFNIVEASSAITYSLLAGIVFLIILTIKVILDAKLYACSQCGYINTDVCTSESTYQYDKRHVETIEGHYVREKTVAKTSGSIDGRTDISHYSGGLYVGSSIGTNHSNISAQTVYETDKWIETHQIDRGNHRHTVTNSQYLCTCCGYVSTHTRETSKYIGH